MHITRYIIVEDELPSQTFLKGLVAEFRPNWNLVFSSGSVEESVYWLRNNQHPDLIFLDIQLADGNGFDIIQQGHFNGLVIFTTSYDEYAIQAFKVNSIDYILKPISKDALLSSLNKFERYSQTYLVEHNQQIDYSLLNSIINSRKINYRTKFLISHGDKYYQLPISNIAYFYSENKITHAVTFEKKEHVINLTLEKLEEQINPDEFFRINRQIIARDESIHTISNWFNSKLTVVLKPEFKDKIVVSRERASSLKQWLDK